ncbi:unnamed protein product [Closterium sp. Naga37s-1]|nr:unnamed protein product [Closterium sp. Naga37s-1]
MIQDAIDVYALTDLRLELIVNTCDHPQSFYSSHWADRAGYPVMSMGFTVDTMDIPIPDPLDLTEDYTPDLSTQVPWERKEARAVFRGKTTNFDMLDGNWGANPRVRLHRLSDVHSALMEAHINAWSHAKPAVIKAMAEDGLLLAKRMNFTQFNAFKYQVIVDGGGGSCRTCGVLRSNQLSIRQETPLFQFYEPLLEDGVHWMVTTRTFSDLPAKIRWAQENDDAAQRLVHAANHMAQYACTWSGRRLYWALLLVKYHDVLQDPSAITEPTANEICTKHIDGCTGRALLLVKHHDVLLLVKYHDMLLLLKYHDMLLLVKYHDMLLLVKYHDMLLLVNYHDMLLLLKYHDMLLLVKYHDMLLLVKYHDMLLLVKYHDMLLLVKYHDMLLLVKYHDVLLLVKYHDVLLLLKYHDMLLLVKYHDMLLLVKYHDMLLLVKYHDMLLLLKYHDMLLLVKYHDMLLLLKYHDMLQCMTPRLPPSPLLPPVFPPPFPCCFLLSSQAPSPAPSQRHQPCSGALCRLRRTQAPAGLCISHSSISPLPPLLLPLSLLTLRLARPCYYARPLLQLPPNATNPALVHCADPDAPKHQPDCAFPMSLSPLPSSTPPLAFFLVVADHFYSPLPTPPTNPAMVHCSDPDSSKHQPDCALFMPPSLYYPLPPQPCCFYPRPLLQPPPNATNPALVHCADPDAPNHQPDCAFFCAKATIPGLGLVWLRADVLRGLKKIGPP